MLKLVGEMVRLQRTQQLLLQMRLVIKTTILLFLQHMISKMRAPEKGGSRIGIVFNGSPLFTGDAGSGESNIRQWIIENDWLEAVVALPDQLFYNTGCDLHLGAEQSQRAASQRQNPTD